MNQEPGNRGIQNHPGSKQDRGYLSGDSNCYRLKFGQHVSCFKSGVGYEASQSDTHVDNIKSWGECALLCKTRSTQPCLYWTWASSSCSNCRPESCTLYATATQELPDKHGFISGEVTCQDIVYVETNPDKVDDPLMLEAYVGNGKCLVKETSPVTFVRPKCVGQEVPGYRFEKFPWTILLNFVQVGCESDLCISTDGQISAGNLYSLLPRLEGCQQKCHRVSV